MPADGDENLYSTARMLRFAGAIVVGLGLAYLGWTFFSRWRENRMLEEKAAAREKAADQRSVEMLGGNRLEILDFYAAPAVIRPGQKAQLCYGVSNAKVVRLEPQDNPVWPSYGRCVDVAPKKDTTYTLTIEDAQGSTKTAMLKVEVRPR
jgi:hypothetical protein